MVNQPYIASLSEPTTVENFIIIFVLAAAAYGATGMYYGTVSEYKWGNVLTDRQLWGRMFFWPVAVGWDFGLWLGERQRLVARLKNILPKRKFMWAYSMNRLRQLNGLPHVDRTQYHQGLGLHNSRAGFNWTGPREAAATPVKVPQELLVGRIAPVPPNLNNRRNFAS